MVVRSLMASLVASATLLAWAPAASAELVMVRVVNEDVTVKTRPSRLAETLAKPQRDTVLEVLSREGTWFWVLVERDSHGTQRAGWVRESDVQFVDSAVARFFPAPMPPPVGEESAAEEVAADLVPVDAASAESAPTAAIAQTEFAAPPASAAGAKLQAKNVDDRKLRKAAAEYEKALQAYEQLQFRSLVSEQPLMPVGEPIIEPLYSLPEN